MASKDDEPGAISLDRFSELREVKALPMFFVLVGPLSKLGRAVRSLLPTYQPLEYTISALKLLRRIRIIVERQSVTFESR